jgi:hypothetical protein
MMTRIGISILLIMALAVSAATFAYAQGQTAPQSKTKPEPTPTMKFEDVTKWTQEQWNAAVAKWSKEKVKWGDCQKQADAKKLSGRESWSFLYGCMTK